MKRFLISFLGLTLVLSMMAQQEKQRKPQLCGKSPLAGVSVEEKASMITDRMVRAYDLTSAQRTKLLELNTRKLTTSNMPDKKGCKKSKCPKDADKKSGKLDNAGYMMEMEQIMTPEQFVAFSNDRAIEHQMFGFKNKHSHHKKHIKRNGHGKSCHCR